MKNGQGNQGEMESLILPRRFLRRFRAAAGRIKVADSTGAELTASDFLIRAMIFRRLLAREVLAEDERYVGLVLPPSVGAVLVNAVLPLMQRIAVNLNYTVSSAVMNSCIRQCNIRHVLTSRKVMERLKLDIDAELVYLEDLAPKITLADKAIGYLQAKLLPLGMLERKLGLDRVAQDDVLTVIFTSGSTGDPKGVVLTHRNVGSNIDGINNAVKLTDQDVTIGVLPFFHSYGYLATLWTVLALGPKGVYHFNPLDAQQVGKLCRKHGVTVFMGTPTFLRTYLRRCEKEDFAKLDVVFASAERLPKELSDAFEAKFGVRPQEAYGCTEMSPLVAVNVPASRTPQGVEASREGTVGMPISNVEAKIVHPETGAPLPQGEAGMLLVRGPNVMSGYLNQPELTAKVIRDGWYVTGDIALLDDGGFIKITGRESRFSKIGGEMVPHIKIEEAIQQIVGGEDLRAVVTAVPDVRKGERLVVVHTELPKPPREISRELAAMGLPNLWIPAPDSFMQVDQIPVLGTGKLDLKGLRDVAAERFAKTPANSPADVPLEGKASGG